MNQLRGIENLSLKFGRGVDRRTFEKVVGAAGGVLGGREVVVGGDGVSVGGSGSGSGRQDGEWIGLRELEVGFHDCSSKHSRRDEV